MQIGTGPFMTEALLRSEASVDFLHCLIGFFGSQTTHENSTHDTNILHYDHTRTYIRIVFLPLSSNHRCVFFEGYNMGRICSGWLAEYELGFFLTLEIYPVCGC